uniref:Reverse transcriptase domain-containing protein n=1 Tax=Rhabditophanes sp. KR3021 TaxID=114890 RepID=A0AC35UHD6_9BILA
EIIEKSIKGTDASKRCHSNQERGFDKLLWFNRYLEERRSPKRCKNSKLLLLFQKGCRKDAANYRPLSLTSHVYKIYAGLILSKLNPILSTEIGPYQHGFKKDVSTANPILIVENILEKPTNTKQTLECYLLIMQKLSILYCVLMYL